MTTSRRDYQTPSGIRLLIIGGTLASVGAEAPAAGALVALSLVTDSALEPAGSAWLVTARQPPVAGGVAVPVAGAWVPAAGPFVPVDGGCEPLGVPAFALCSEAAEPVVGLLQVAFALEPVAVDRSGVLAGGGVAEFAVDCPLVIPAVTAASAFTRPWP
jgi:hypothetical protein